MRVENLDISIQQPEMKRCSVGIKCMCVYVIVCLGYLFVLYLFRFFLCFFFVCISLFFLVGGFPGSRGQYSFLTFIKIQDEFDRLKPKICLTQKSIQMPMMLPHCCVKKKKSLKLTLIKFHQVQNPQCQCNRCILRLRCD